MSSNPQIFKAFNHVDNNCCVTIIVSECLTILCPTVDFSGSRTRTLHYLAILVLSNIYNILVSQPNESTPETRFHLEWPVGARVLWEGFRPGATPDRLSVGSLQVSSSVNVATVLAFSTAKLMSAMAFGFWNFLRCGGGGDK